MRDGHYAAAFGTLVGMGRASLRLEGGVITGETERGAKLTGAYGPTDHRDLMAFSLTAHLPATYVAVTGLETGEGPRRVNFKGEVKADGTGARLSVDFAGRAIDIFAWFDRPL